MPRYQVGIWFEAKNAEKAARDTERFGSAAKSSGRAARGLKADLGALVAGYVTLRSAMALLRTAFEAAEFGREMKKVETLVGVARGQVKAWGEELKTLGPELGRSPKELAQALFAVTSAGLRGSAAMDVLESSGKAAAIGLGDTRSVALAVTSAIQAYGSENLSAAQATDVLVATIREGNLEASSLAPVLGRVIGIANQVGVSFQEVGGFVATFTRLGVNAEESITALRGVLTSLIGPTKQQEEALAQAEMTMASFRAEIQEKGLAAALVDLVARFKGNEDALAAIIPNVRALSGVLGTAGSQGDEFVRIQESIQDSLGLTEEAFASLADDPAFKIDQMRATLEVIRIELGERLLPTVVAAAEVLRDFLMGDEAAAFARDFVVGLEGISGAVNSVAKWFGAKGDLTISWRETQVVLARGQAAIIHGFVGWVDTIARVVGGLAKIPTPYTRALAAGAEGLRENLQGLRDLAAGFDERAEQLADQIVAQDLAGESGRQMGASLVDAFDEALAAAKKGAAGVGVVGDAIAKTKEEVAALEKQMEDLRDQADVQISIDFRSRFEGDIEFGPMDDFIDGLLKGEGFSAGSVKVVLDVEAPSFAEMISDVTAAMDALENEERRLAGLAEQVARAWQEGVIDNVEELFAVAKELNIPVAQLESLYRAGVVSFAELDAAVRDGADGVRELVEAKEKETRSSEELAKANAKAVSTAIALANAVSQIGGALASQGIIDDEWAAVIDDAATVITGAASGNWVQAIIGVIDLAGSLTIALDDASTMLHVTLSDGISSAIGLTSEWNDAALGLLDSMQDSFERIAELTGANLDHLAEIEILLDEEGNATARVGDHYEQTFDNLQDAVDWAMRTALMASEWSGLTEEMAQLFERARDADSFSEVMQLLGVLQGIIDDRAGQTASEIRRLEREFAILIDRFQELGVSTGILREEFVGSLEDIRDQIIGVEQSEYERRLDAARQFNSELERLQANAEDEIMELFGELAQAFADQGMADAAEAMVDALGNAAEIGIGGMLAVAETAAHGAQVTADRILRIQEAIAELEAYLGSLPDPIDPSEIRRKGSGTKKRDRERLDDLLADADFEHYLAGLGDLDRALAESNRKWNEAEALAHGNAEQLAQVAAARERENEAIEAAHLEEAVERWQALGGAIADFVGGPSSELADQVAALEEQARGLIDGLFESWEDGAVNLHTVLEQTDEILEALGGKVNQLAKEAVPGLLSGLANMVTDEALRQKMVIAAEKATFGLQFANFKLELAALKAVREAQRQKLAEELAGIYMAMGLSREAAMAIANAMLVGMQTGLDLVIDLAEQAIADIEANWGEIMAGFDAQFDVEAPDLSSSFDATADASAELEAQIEAEARAREEALRLLEKYEKDALPDFIAGLREITSDFATIRAELGNTIRVQSAYAGALEDLVRDTLSDIRSLREELLFGDDTSTLSAVERFELSKSDLEAAFDAIIGGDFTRLEDFDELAKQALELNPFAQGSEAYRLWIEQLDAMLAGVEQAVAGEAGVDLGKVFDDALGLNEGANTPMERIRREHGRLLDRIAWATERMAGVRREENDRLARILEGDHRFGGFGGALPGQPAPGGDLRSEAARAAGLPPSATDEEIVRLLRRIDRTNEDAAGGIRQLGNRRPIYITEGVA